jgi:hypothetical protein
MAMEEKEATIFKVDLQELADPDFYDQYRTPSNDPRLHKLLEEYDDVFKQKLPKIDLTKT